MLKIRLENIFIFVKLSNVPVNVVLERETLKPLASDTKTTG